MFGPHVNRTHAKTHGNLRTPLSAHIEAARVEAEQKANFKIGAVAVFVCGPHNREITLTDEEGLSLKASIERTGIVVIAHSTYTAVPWSGDPDAARCIREESKVCRAAGIKGLVVHLPKAPIETVLKYVARLISTEGAGVRIYFETPAVVPKESYYETPEKLRDLFAALREKLDPTLAWFGLCVDTAHLWTSGIDLTSYDDANAWLARLEAVADVIPADRVMFHLNDSMRPRGVGPDTHAELTAGEIWKDYKHTLAESGIAAFVDYAKRHDTPVILERKGPGTITNDYRILRDLGV